MNFNKLKPGRIKILPYFLTTSIEFVQVTTFDIVLKFAFNFDCFILSDVLSLGGNLNWKIFLIFLVQRSN